MTEALKQSILTTMDEIADAQHALGIEPESDEVAEAWFLIERLEAKFAKAAAE